MAEKVPGWLQRILLPQISELKGDIKRLEGRIDGVDGRIEGVDSRIEGVEGTIEGIEGRIEGVEGKIEGLEGQINGLQGRMDGGFAAVHSELKRLDEKFTGEFRRLDQRMDSMDKKIEYGDRFSVIEKRLATLEARK